MNVAILKPQRLLFATPVYAAVITFLTYAMVYGFRKPFTVATYQEVSPVWGVAYKSCLVISQVVGYMLSKFYGIKFIAGLKRIGRGKLIVLLVVISWIALLLFAVVPAPFNMLFLLLNGFPLGLIWGVVFSFVEGRKATDFIGASLAVSFIFSSGCVKTITSYCSCVFISPISGFPFLQVESFWFPYWFLYGYWKRYLCLPRLTERCGRKEKQ